MTVRNLIVRLLCEDLNKEVSIQYPSLDRNILYVDGSNYSAYEEATEFKIVAGSTGVIIGVDDDN